MGKLKAIIPERLFTSLSSEYEYGKAVLIEGESIASIVPVTDIPEDVATSVYKDCTLLPGLIDTHCHLEDWSAPLFLQHGITTVRDTGNDLDYILAKKAEMEKPEAPGPSIRCCGPVLDGMPYIHPVLSWGIKQDEDVPLAIAYLQSRQVDAIKLYAGLDINKVKIAVETCAQAGIHLLGHFQGKLTLLEAIKAGVPEAEHFVEVPDYYSEEIILEIIKRDAWVVPTQMVWEGIFHYQESQAIRRYFDAMPESAIKRYSNKFLAEKTRQDPLLMKLKAFCRNNRSYIQGMIKLGGKIAPGTDAPCQFALPGISYLAELQVFSECGMTNSDILKCATLIAADLLGLKARSGSIEKGKKADMLIVEGDPLKNLPDLKRIKCIYKRGYKHLPDETLVQVSPASRTGYHLPDMSEQASVYDDWKLKYLT